MPIQLDEQNGGKTLVVHVSGKLAKEDYQHFVPEFERLVRQHGKLRVLFDMTGFHGWEAGALWDDSRWLGKRSGSKGWRRSANRSQKRRSNTLITRKLPMPGCGWTRGLASRMQGSNE
jgi:hypothetical protein